MLFEIKIIEWLQSFSSQPLDILTGYASFFFDYAIIIAVFLLFYFSNRKAYAGYFAIVECFAALVQFTAKHIFARPRPHIASESVVNIFSSSGYSFPSGHSVTAMGVFIFLIFFIYTQNRSKKERATFTVIGVVYLLMNMFNRMYLGQHYLTDIIGGYLLMIAICALAFLLYKPYLRFYNFILGNIEKRIEKKKVESKEKKTAGN